MIKIIALIAWILVLLVSTSASQTKKEGPVQHLLKSLLANDEVSIDSVKRFFIVGDFGDLTAREDLDQVTDAMNKLASKNKYDFIATVGDNVYENGIESMDKLDDVKDIMTYFKKPNIKKMPMFLTLGNHDWVSDIQNSIDFSKVDEQWNMDEDFYELKYPLKDDPSKSFVLLMANSCKLACLNDVKDSDNSEFDCGDMNVKVGEDKVIAHYDWVEEKLAKHTADPDVAWLGVVMHHPLFIEPSMKQDFLPILMKYKVDFAMVGHKHMFEYANMDFDGEIKFPGKAFGDIIDDWTDKDEIINSESRTQVFNKGEKFHQFLIGGSGRKLKDICPYKEQDGDVYFQNVQKHGMVTIEVESNYFNVKYLNSKQEIIYDVTITQ